MAGDLRRHDSHCDVTVMIQVNIVVIWIVREIQMNIQKTQ